MASWLMKNVKDGSLLKGVKDGSRRLKDEFARSIGGGADDSVDPVLEYRTFRFNRYNDRLEDLSKAMTQYSNAMRTYAQATSHLMHAFSAFFESQMQNAQDAVSSCENGDQLSKIQPLAQSSLRVEEIQQSLKENVFDVAQSLQFQAVMQPMQELRSTNAALNLQLRALKQKISDYDSAQRNAEAQRKSPPDYEKAQQKVVAAAASLASIAQSVDADLSVIEARRDSTLKNELLTVVATQIFVHARANEHFQQLVPLLPGVVKPLVLLLAESARRRQPVNPITSDIMGVISYCGKFSRGTLNEPLNSHRAAFLDVAAVHPITIGPFKEMHFGEKLAAGTYST
ncbi:putative BAR domain-containing protein [Plasmopara halstedii]